MGKLEKFSMYLGNSGDSGEKFLAFEGILYGVFEGSFGQFCGTFLDTFRGISGQFWGIFWVLVG